MAAQEHWWWDKALNMPVESYAADFTDPEDYRGINAAMHTVEAYLAVADVTGDVTWLNRAIQIIDFAVNVQARANDWRLPEHYDTSWKPLLDYNRDQPAHPFRPYGVTPGHGLEWSRLTVQARAGLVARSLPAPEWMLDAAEELFDRARLDGWRVDGGPGFVYTTDFSGKPIVHERMHWVACEGISAAAAIRRALLDDGRGEIEVEHYEHHYRSSAPPGCGPTSSTSPMSPRPAHGRGTRTSTTPCRPPSPRACPSGPPWVRRWRRGAWTSPPPSSRSPPSRRAGAASSPGAEVLSGTGAGPSPGVGAAAGRRGAPAVVGSGPPLGALER